jgi:hypothetical protein
MQKLGRRELLRSGTMVAAALSLAAMPLAKRTPRERLATAIDRETGHNVCGRRLRPAPYFLCLPRAATAAKGRSRQYS